MHDPWVDPETSPGLSRGCLPAWMRWWSLPGTGSVGGSCLRECARPAIMDGQSVVESDAWIAGDSVYRGLVPGG